ncbi:DUF5362 family protein [Sulfitobacter sp. R18_1]|uniref:DUF5362 family protein n=1 Tax=Sulfitobacter sp. R18_1 TaxID=2821104 RepID=UPI001ADACAA3|nr:hypothetical protein [Sulfitobacter sp. R18_1]
MQKITVKGKITYVGEAVSDTKRKGNNPHRMWKYSTVVFKEEGTGKEITVLNVQADSQMSRHLHPGWEGTFAFIKNSTGANLLGFKNGDVQTIQNEVRMKKFQTRYPLALIIIGALLSLTIVGAFIGIPMIGFAIYIYIYSSKLFKATHEMLMDNDFDLSSENSAKII